MFKKILLGFSFCTLSLGAQAQIANVVIDIQNGSNYMAMVIMKEKFWEDVAKEKGIKTTLELNKVGGPGAAAERFLSGANQGMTISYPLILSLHEKTNGDTKILFGNSIIEIYLNVNNPGIKTATDFKEGNKVAVTTLNTSIQAINMRALSDKLFGDYKKLDPITVQMPHPDAFAALMAGKIDGHWASPPFSFSELKDSKVKAIAKSSDIFGPANLTAFATSEKFCKKETKVCDALFEAHKKANDWINADFKKAAEYFAQNVGTKDTTDDYYQQFVNKDIIFTPVPQGIQAYANYALKFGLIKKPLKSWKDLTLPVLHSSKGS